jgi:hypothetical protein
MRLRFWSVRDFHGQGDSVWAPAFWRTKGSASILSTVYEPIFERTGSYGVLIAFSVTPSSCFPSHRHDQLIDSILNRTLCPRFMSHVVTVWQLRGPGADRRSGARWMRQVR